MAWAFSGAWGAWGAWNECVWAAKAVDTVAHALQERLVLKRLHWSSPVFPTSLTTDQHDMLASVRLSGLNTGKTVGRLAWGVRKVRQVLRRYSVMRSECRWVVAGVAERVCG
jgi:hypothetical protein